MSALKSANKELKGMMKTVKIQDIDVCFSNPDTFLSRRYVVVGSDHELTVDFMSTELTRRDDGSYGCEQ